MDEFIGRRKELELMESWYAGDNFEFVAIYGRRRVGKTTLIERFLDGKRAIFFSARRTKGNSNVRLFNDIVKSTFNNNDERILYFDDLFGMIADNADERLVLMIDEFPYFAESDEDLISALQVFIDRIAKKTKLFLILCGSSVGFMKRQVLGYESPLYGRRTHEMHILPMNYRESAEFLEGRGNYEKACVYGAVGGIPLYLKKFSGKENIFGIMEKEFFSEGSVMSSEPESLILQELKDPKKYNDIIEAMAKGLTRISEISDRSGIVAAETSRYLNDLIDLGYVEKVMPLNENAERRSRYYLSDNLFRFCYQMVVGRKQVLSGASPEETSKNLEVEFQSYMGRTFEGMCAQYVKEKMGYPLTGKWWGSPSKDVNAEVDLIGSVGKKGRTEGLFAECKFTNRPAGIGNLERLKENAGYVKGFDVRHYAIFSRSGFDDDLTDIAEIEGISLVTLDMMY